MSKENILDAIAEFIKEKNAAKTWTAGKDMVNYAGPFFDHDEIVAAAGTLLDGWLVMGKDCLRFETKFPKYFGKDHGVITN